MLEHIFSNWTDWQNQDTPVLMTFTVATRQIVFQQQRPDCTVQTYPWGHQPTSLAAPPNTGGIRPAATIDESDNIYHWSPSFYCRVNGNHRQQQLHHRRTRKKSPNQQRPITFHGIAYARQRHLTIGSGGTAAEFSASLFFDVVHGHQNR